MKKNYVTPVMVGEQFEVNEFIAVCFGIACITGIEGQENGKIDPKNPIKYGSYGTYHTQKANTTGCGHEYNQFIREEDGKYTMIEMNTERDGNLPCTLYSDSNWNNKINYWEDLETGDMVYWSTNIKWGSGTTTMYHHGSVNLEDESHPNRS